MKMSAMGLEALKHREGVMSRMYRDSAGLPSIGVGHQLTRDELSSGKLHATRVRWGQGLTMAQIDDLLRHDLATAEAAVNYGVRVPVNQRQFDALVSFAFNVGAQAFADSTLVKHLNAGNYEAVPGQMKRWVYAAGRIDEILKARREDEIIQWEGTAA